MMLKHLSKALILAGITLMSTGCSSMFEIGEDPTECPKAQSGGITCTSAREIWKLTDNKKDLEEARQRSNGELQEKEDSDEDDGKEVKPMPYPGGTPEERQAIYRDYQDNRSKLAAPEPIAVRQPAKVLRVLMNSWEDDLGRLHIPGYTYVEIEKRRWVVGRGASAQPARITPLSIRKASLEDERRNNPVADNSMGIIQPVPVPQPRPVK
ncbi:TraV family lipoprotein [Vibrio cholerae]|uniref:Conjugal transfer protein TraV n=3 Tax=Vibrio TaxID=662 RepID=A0A7Z7YDK8_VIBCL|nr:MULTISPECIES: TraV family lipoprotein [Vibrio]EJL6490512.1 TraV family lipoprotein [Vibrio cholerae]EJL6642203.1 TraV family lipoprotein [Vibrio cholerae]MBL4244033.1 TraV family lipoprotein [Vibrio fluvialis]MBL4252949.1 TraV family lipoprotein [Vibrio fluvialis]MCI9701217.1 TraV family lipoprotein [Vibrio parahaemolyticus]